MCVSVRASRLTNCLIGFVDQDNLMAYWLQDIKFKNPKVKIRGIIYADKFQPLLGYLGTLPLHFCAVFFGEEGKHWHDTMESNYAIERG